MPSVTIAMSNGHNSVSGISFRKVAQDESAHKTNGGPYSTDDVNGDIHRPNGLNGVDITSSEKKVDAASVDAIRMRLKKGRANGNRNGVVYDSRVGLSFHNNNGPLKAFPLNTNKTTKEVETNTNNSSLPYSSPDLSSLNSSSDSSAPSTLRVASPRPPLQRLHGRGHKKQHLPSELTNPTTGSESNETAQKAETSSPKSNGRTESLNATFPNANPPLKSALHRNGSGGDTRPKIVVHKEIVTFAEYNLPPGLKELHSECFIPGAKGFFQHRPDIPLLITTDAAILKRRSSISQTKKNRIPTPTQKSKAIHNAKKPEEGGPMVRSRSAASEIFVQPDIEILKACWNIILSFMGDDKGSLPKVHAHRTIGSIISPKKRKLWRKSSADIPRSTSPMPSTKVGVGESGTRPNSMFILPTPAPPSPKKVPNKPHSSVPVGKNLPHSVSGLTVFDKVHFLVNVGLKLPYLRDEIYCLIIKQLVNNPSPYSTALGWILFALITGSFPPSEKVLTHVEAFINHHRHAWSKYCGERLKRTVKNGPRTNPPCSLEIQAAKSAERILFPVICMDNSAMTVSVDPATTSKEMLESMAGKSRIGDPFGYCIVMHSGGKIVNLGSGRFPVMDALSQVEMSAGRKFGKNACRLYYRRDIFSPRDLFRSSDDNMALRLTFYQVCGGVRTGEYICKQASDLTLLVAHQYCVRYGMEIAHERRVSKFCEKCLPPDVYKTDKKNWCRMVTNTVLALRRKQSGPLNPVDIMAQVIRYTMLNLSQNFQRTYSIMTFAKVGGVCTYTSELSITLSHQGVTVRQGDAIHIGERSGAGESDVVTVPVVLMEIPADNLKKVKLETRSCKSGTTLTITDCVEGSYEITSAHGPEIYSVLFRYIRDIANGANKESRA